MLPFLIPHTMQNWFHFYPRKQETHENVDPGQAQSKPQTWSLGLLLKATLHKRDSNLVRRYTDPVTDLTSILNVRSFR